MDTIVMERGLADATMRKILLGCGISLGVQML